MGYCFALNRNVIAFWRREELSFEQSALEFRSQKAFLFLDLLQNAPVLLGSAR